MELKVTRWQRFGHDRLYANLPDGTAVGWADLKMGDITVLRAEYRDDVIAVLTKHLPDYLVTIRPARATEAEARPTLPRLTPADDLATNPPGESLRLLLTGSGPGLLERAVSRLLRRPTEWDSWRKGLAGERRVGAELNRLSRHGWRVLHSIPLADKVDVDHLLIGPGGVFSINTKHHHKKAVWVGDEAVKVDHGKPAPYARKSRAEAKRVVRVLERYCDFPVPVDPVLVFVGVTDLKVVATQLTVRVYRERQVAALAPLSGVLTAEQVEQVYGVARHRQAWRQA
ncbi:NERD domain-containing protein [Streptomyces sp. NBC_01728]|uniref:nuclease-related domain-containing protein n=1 Tax=unclassified Streptomyces TaxID=2593676 RepID=UPI00225A2C8A|nr:MULTISPECIES: nuclease-related domain-containing protein [unclassified Streptomyces]MCX4456814.1 NERD domain-containing protein [Streptomyces sp. NBC_01719]MCX4496173.1 NERD domain-containing protein [Streptomyces sp. NBC_01728]